MDPRGLRVTRDEYFSLSTYIKQLFLVIFCAKTAEIGSVMGQDNRVGRHSHMADVNIEIVM